MGTSAILAAIDEEILRLQQVKQLLNGSSAKNGQASRSGRFKEVNAEAVTASRRILSPEARKRIADAQRKRWAAYKKATK